MPHRAASPPLRAAATPCLRRGGLPALQPQQPWQPLARPVRRRQQHVQPPQALALPEALSALEASPARDFAAAAFAVAGSVALIKFFDTLERMGIIDKVRAAVMGAARVLSRVLPRVVLRVPATPAAHHPGCLPPPARCSRPVPRPEACCKLV